MKNEIHTARLERQMLTVPEVARYIRVTDDTVYRWVGQRTIPFTKVKRRTVFDKRDVDAWLDQNTVRPMKARAGQHKAEETGGA